MNLEAATYPYHLGQDRRLETPMPKMPKRKIRVTESFGKRLARLRKAAGYSQRSLADELGISYRVVAYYEAQTEHAQLTFCPPWPTHSASPRISSSAVSLSRLARPRRTDDSSESSDSLRSSLHAPAKPSSSTSRDS